MIAGGGRTELRAAQATTTTPATVMVPAGTVLTSESTVFDPETGRWYQVLGEPADRGRPVRFRAAALRRISDRTSS